MTASTVAQYLAALPADRRAAFTLSRPQDGCALGDYRAEFYVDEVLAETVKLKIVK